MTSTTSTVRDLRRRWKPHKERLATSLSEHPTNIRFHRACSWLQRVEQSDGEEDVEFILLGQWIALNALYGQWSDTKCEPLPDMARLQTFMDRILDLDKEGRVVDALQEHKPLVMAILDDEYLSRFFWEEPGQLRARKSRKVKYNAQTWYIEGRWKLVCDHLLKRIYLLRCQLVHGAASYGSSLNRTPLRRCTTMLEHLLPAILSVWIDDAADEDWGLMCYPPNPLKMHAD